ncbi:hypothetical protein ACOSP7_013592 [Xanthoceras sorbifolium]
MRYFFSGLPRNVSKPDAGFGFSGTFPRAAPSRSSSQICRVPFFSFLVKIDLITLNIGVGQIFLLLSFKSNVKLQETIAFCRELDTCI